MWLMKTKAVLSASACSTRKPDAVVMACIGVEILHRIKRRSPVALCKSTCESTERPPSILMDLFLMPNFWNRPVFREAR